ncbi:MAG TPA: hypothetical protein VMP12_04690 [Candidatus Sulfotelmatobacter sp.]|nr:hypothetical protein [Candidatus Sulfotelmatobacter sp.]
MDQPPAAPRNAPAENRFPPIVRALGIGVLVLILWSVDKVVVRRIPQGSVWRYIVGGIIISVGLATVLSFTDRLSGEKS